MQQIINLLLSFCNWVGNLVINLATGLAKLFLRLIRLTGIVSLFSKTSSYTPNQSKIKSSAASSSKVLILLIFVVVLLASIFVGIYLREEESLDFSSRQQFSSQQQLAPSQTSLWQTLECEGKEIQTRLTAQDTTQEIFLVEPSEDSTRITQKIILADAAQARNFSQNGVEFEIELDQDIAFEPRGHGVWYFKQQDGPDLFRIPRSSAKDAASDFTNNVQINVHQEEAEKEKITAQLTIADADWLTSAERQFPITTSFIIEIVPEKRN